MTFDPKKFEETVSTVAAEDNEADTARTEKRRAEAALLTRIIEMARPALFAIGTRPVIRYEVAHHADVNYGGGVHSQKRAKERYIPLSSSNFEPDEDCPQANEGRYEGRTLAVRANDDELVCFTFSGSWSRWQGSSWGYEAEITKYWTAVDAIADGWTDVQEYIDQLSELLQAAVGKRKKSTEADLKRAEKLTALTSLLR